MLAPAIAHEKEVTTLLQQVAFDPKYWNWHCSPYAEMKADLTTSTWEKIQMVSIAVDTRLLFTAEVIGYFSASINRINHSVTKLSVCRVDGTSSPEQGENIKVFASDLRKFLRMLLLEYNFEKINWQVVCGSELEVTYDRMCKRAGGRVVGVFENEIRLPNNESRDIKVYELTRKAYLLRWFRKPAIAKGVITTQERQPPTIPTPKRGSLGFFDDAGVWHMASPGEPTFSTLSMAATHFWNLDIEEWEFIYL